MGRLLKGRGSQKTCLASVLHLCGQQEMEQYKKGSRKQGAALQASTLEGLFFAAVTDKLI